jgi:xanthine dehydrogenase large subunit
VSLREKPEALLRHVRKPLPHDSAIKQVQGAAPYIDDLPEPQGTLHVAVGGAPAARGTITRLDLDRVRATPGVVVVITAADIPAKNCVSAHMDDEPILADGRVDFHGQPVFAVAATSRDAARRAVALAMIEVAAEPPAVTVDQGLATGERVLPDYAFLGGDPGAAIASAPQKAAGTLRMGGQEHFYLEGQIALAVPGEDGAMLVHSSTQHPTEVQHIVARALGVPDAFVTCEIRRMGGGFGGKETQASQWAAVAAVAARVTRRPCKLRLDRDDDFVMTGKRHDFRVDWSVGFDRDGRIAGLDMLLAARCGISADCSAGVVDRAMFHADNTYHLPAFRIDTRRVRTNTVSNTAFRGFGGPQGMLAAERVIDAIAWQLGRDPLDIRKANFYAPGRDQTPYGQVIEDHDVGLALIEELERTSDYRARRAEIAAFNRTSPILKRGLALTPLKFGISFTLASMNQAGALVHVYQDGSVHLNHGGTEMGQGLFQKVAQIAAEEFGIALDRVRITPTSTEKVPNTSPTAASSGSDLNGMAVQAAARTIKARMVAFAAEHWSVPEEQVVFQDDHVLIGNQRIGFGDLAKAAHGGRVSLSSTGYYRTPKLHWDRARGLGHPFFYYAWGAAVSEVLIDATTGENKVLRADILHDVGRSLNPAIDIGQIEGGFVQGMGWLTAEELVFDGKGRLATHAPSTYKIPTATDVPAVFNTWLYPNPGPRDGSIYQSKAVGEPPFNLAISVWCAILDALKSLAPGRLPPLDAPATPEAVLKAVAALKAGEGA